MLKTIRNNVALFILLLLAQVLVLEQIDLGELSPFINPMLYVWFVLMLPFETPKTLTMILALILGLCIDAFYNSLGVHASASLFLALCRIQCLKLLTPRDGYDSTHSPTLYDMGKSWFFLYTGSLVVLHHIWLFTLEVFRFTGFSQTLLKSLSNATFTILLILLCQFVFIKPKKHT